VTDLSLTSTIFGLSLSSRWEKDINERLIL